MARLELSGPPAFRGRVDYSKYKPWLLENFFDNLCSYCLVQHGALQVDHYEPNQYAPARAHDPANLLLACGNCNGPAGKSDYHPSHSSRKRLPADTTGYHALDVRSESLGQLYEIDPSSGTLRPKPGPLSERAAWNASRLFKLDLPFLNDHRAMLLDIVQTSERLLTEIDRRAGETICVQLSSCLDILARHLAKQYLMLRAFDISVSPALLERLSQIRPA